MLSGQKDDEQPKLILHVDIRNTVFAADSIGNLLVEQGINSYLTGVCWGTVDEKTDKWSIATDKPSLKPPFPGAITYYKYLEKRSINERSKLRLATANFVSEDEGAAFKPTFNECLEKLKWHHANNNSITAKGLDGQNYHYIFKSFLNLIRQLSNDDKHYAIIFRTFGIDAKGTLSAIDSTIRNKHPDFPNGLGNIKLCKNIFNLQRGAEDNYYQTMKLVDSTNDNTVCTGESEIFEWMSSATGIKAVKDDFLFWEKNSYSNKAGKPFWTTKREPPRSSNGSPCYHIIIDDNIRTWESDSIVNFRYADGDTFGNMPDSSVAELENICYVQADLIEAICDPNYFIKLVSTCEKNMNKMYGTE